jgi:cell division protein FtsZ
MREGPLAELFRSTQGDPRPSSEAPAIRDTDALNAELASYVATIRVVGVGGAGCNALNRMVEAGVRGVEFIAVNTDRQSLDASEAEVRIPAGLDITRGLGTGGDVAKGMRALRMSEEQLRRALRGSDLVFIAAGQGGGTGTGGAPVVAKIARELDALTIAVVTRPFRFEGPRRMMAAEQGIEALQELADTVIVIPNDRLMSVLDRGTSMVRAFQVCDDLLRQGVQGICDLITLPGLINLDFADVRTIIRGAGSALLGIGYASGANRATEAALAAIASPLLETPIDGARGILLGLTGGPDLSLLEVNEAARVVAEAADPEANIIFGATIDEALEGQVWVTVVAANFSGRRAAPPRPAPEGVHGGTPVIRGSNPGVAGRRRPESVVREVAEPPPAAADEAPEAGPGEPAHDTGEMPSDATQVMPPAFRPPEAPEDGA